MNGQQGFGWAAVLVAFAVLGHTDETPRTTAGAGDRAEAGPHVTLKPGDDLQRVVERHPPGTTFVFEKGTYRLQMIHPKDGDTFVSSGGTVLSGARELTKFTREGNLWVASGQDQQGQINGDCDKQHPRCMHPEDLFFDDHPLRHVADRSAVGPGTWFLDYRSHKIYFSDDPAGHKVEASVARSAFASPARNVTIRGLIIEKYAVPAQFGAIGDQYPGPNWMVADNEVRWNHGTGIHVESGSQALNNHVHHNGQKGIGANGQNVLVEGNEISFNNWAGFDIGWEAGGTKFAQTDHLIARKNQVHDNVGAGLWVDENCIHTLLEDNVVENNLGGGIQYEISYAGTIRDNVVRNNANFASPWMWGAQILLMNSRDVEVYLNKVEVPADRGNGIGIIQQNRGTGAYGAHVAANNYVHNNSVVYRGSPNGTSGVVGDYNQESLLRGENNRFDYNTYRVTDASAAHWMWGGFETWEGMHKLGQELHGHMQTGPR